MILGTLNFSRAITSPAAFGLLEITTDGLTFLILPDSIAVKIDSMLLPLPEINIPRFNKDNLDKPMPILYTHSTRR
jgi:hypothetical protein